MAKERNDLKAGIFIVVSIALIMTVVLSIKGLGRLFDPAHRRTVSFKLADDLSGLRVGDEVRLGGFKIGTVEEIDVMQLPPGALPKPATAPSSRPASQPADDRLRIVVRFAIPRKYELREDAHIAIQTTITGAASLNIESLGQGAKVESEKFVLAGFPSAMSALLANLGEASPQFGPIAATARETLVAAKETIHNVNGAVTDVRQQVIPKTSETIVTYKDAGAHVRDLLGDTKMDLRDTIASVKDATGTLKTKLPEAMDKANALLTKLNTTIEDAKGSLEDVKSAVANTKEITAQVRDVVGGNRGKLDSMIASLKTTGDNLKAASSEIRRSPWRLLYKPGKGEMANLNLYDSARQFADGANNLSDAAAALRDALTHKSADPEEIQKLIDKLDKSFASFNDVENKLWSEVKE